MNRKMHNRGMVLSASEDYLQQLQDEVCKLKLELSYSQAEVKKVTDNLNCLMSLVRQAWNGDQESAVHVANIVDDCGLCTGIAPPDRVDIEDSDSPHMIYKPKPRHLNNWAKLVIGVLNREYKTLERDLEAQRLEWLSHRELYLDEQIQQNRDQQVMRQRAMSVPANSMTDLRAGENNAFLTQPPSTPVRAKSATQKSKGGMLKKGLVRQLYKTTAERRLDLGINVSDIFSNRTQHGNQDTSSAMSGLYRLPSETTDKPNQHIQLPYDDPNRYTKAGVYSTGMVMNPPRRRPPSGVEQRKADARRAKSRSASAAHRRQAQSLSQNGQLNSTTVPSARPRLRTQSLTDLHDAARHVEDTEVTQRDTTTPVPAPMKVTVEQPKNVSVLEDDFLKMAVDLQRKLGINPDGMIY